MATVPWPCMGCVAAVAMAPLARRRSVVAPPGPTSWASIAQADVVGCLPLAGVRTAATRTWTELGATGAAGGAAVSRCRRGRPPFAMEATPVEIQCLWKPYHAPCLGPALGSALAEWVALACS